MSQSQRGRETEEDVKEALGQYLLAVSYYWRDYWMSGNKYLRIINNGKEDGNQIVPCIMDE